MENMERDEKIIIRNFENEFFDNKIKPLLLWMGTIVSVITAIAYIVIVFVLIEGFKAETLLNTTVFSIITALVGFCIMLMLKMQGQAFAQNLHENKEISKEYNRTKTKDKKARSMRYYWLTSGALDILFKALTLAITSIGMIYIMIEGSKDYNLIWLAAVNLLMFTGFGLMGLVHTYDFYNDSYVPYMMEQINATMNLACNLDDKVEQSSTITVNLNQENETQINIGDTQNNVIYIEQSSNDEELGRTSIEE